MLFQPMPLSRRAEPFNHPDWLYEIKWDGFRALLYSEGEDVGWWQFWWQLACKVSLLPQDDAQGLSG